MEINRPKNNSVVIKGKKETVIINPDDKLASGSRIWIYSQLKNLVPRPDEKVLIAGPGEYEIGGVEIIGVKLEQGGLLYSINVEGVKFGLLSNTEEEITEKKLDKIGEVDVLIFELGESNGKTAKTIMGLGKKMGANYLIPISYSEGSEALKKFLDDSDNEGEAPVESLKFDKEDLPDGMEVILLKNNNGK